MDEMKEKDTAEKIIISNHQLSSLAVGVTIGGTIIVVTGQIATIAQQDAWIVGLLTMALGVPVIWLYFYLGKQYPEMSIIGMANQIFGKWPGRVVAAFYIFFFIWITFHMTWHLYDFVGHILHETPGSIITASYVIAMVIAILYGIEAFARASEILITFTLIIFFISMFLLLPKINIENLLPVLEEGIVPELKATFFLAAYTIYTLIALMMVFPHNLHDLQQGGKAIRRGYLWGMLVVTIVLLMSILVLGPNISANTRFAAYLFFMEIDIGGVFTRLEFVVAIIWLITLFIVDTTFFYAGVKGFAELFALKDYRKIVIPIGFIILVMYNIAFPDAIFQINWDAVVWPCVAFTFGLAIPLIMLLVFWIKKKFFKQG